MIFLRLFSEICQFILTPRLGTELSVIFNTARTMYAVIAVTEILLAIVIAVLLHFGYQGLGFKKFDSIIDKLVRYTICSGAVTAISAIAALVSISAFPKSTMHAVFGSLKAKSESICLPILPIIFMEIS